LEVLQVVLAYTKIVWTLGNPAYHPSTVCNRVL
jgi:hypothetical protein